MNTYSKPRPGADYLAVQLVFILLFIIFPQIQCRNGCFIWTPGRMILFGIIYAGLLWYFINAFRVRYRINNKILEYRAAGMSGTLNLNDMAAFGHIPGFSFRALTGFGARNAVNRYNDLILITMNDGKKWLISPAGTDDFLNELKQVLPEQPNGE